MCLIYKFSDRKIYNLLEVSKIINITFTIDFISHNYSNINDKLEKKFNLLRQYLYRRDASRDFHDRLTFVVITTGGLWYFSDEPKTDPNGPAIVQRSDAHHRKQRNNGLLRLSVSKEFATLPKGVLMFPYHFSFIFNSGYDVDDILNVNTHLA